ncbi:MAG: hypothetical protein LBL31_02895 [Spirochaetaceae bacterium]|jgi:hypothetical protein|nr:hypothetical protein [Spirochaetaceae bacterium]
MMVLFALLAVAAQLASSVWTNARRIAVIHTLSPQIVFDIDKSPVMSHDK